MSHEYDIVIVGAGAAGCHVAVIVFGAEFHQCIEHGADILIQWGGGLQGSRGNAPT